MVKLGVLGVLLLVHSLELSGIRAEAPLSSVLINKCCDKELEYSQISSSKPCVPAEKKSDGEETETTTTNPTAIDDDSESKKYENPRGSELSYFSKPWIVNGTITLPMEATLGTDGKPEYMNFRLQVNYPSAELCANGSFLLRLNTSSNSTLLFTPEGQLRYENNYYPPQEYCLAKVEEKAVTFHICRPTCSGKVPCIRKCCNLNQVWDQGKGLTRQKCVAAGTKKWRPEFYKTTTTLATPDEISGIHPHYIVAHPKEWCNLSAYIPFSITQQDQRGNPQSKFRIKLNGEVIWREHRYKWDDKEYDRAFYCVDGRVNPPHNAGSSINETEYSGLDSKDSFIFQCGPMKEELNTAARSVLYGGAMIVSCIFLLITLVVYFLLWEEQNVHGWTMMAYAGSLFFMYFFLVLMHFASLFLQQTTDGTPSKTCYFIAVGVHFSFISTFCWMTMVNYDLWCTFRALMASSGNSKGFKRFLAYAIFGVGGPVVTVTVACVLASQYGDDNDSGIVVPDYGLKRCHLDADAAQFYYAYGPAGFLLIINVAFFLITVYSLYKILQSTKPASKSKSQKQQQSVKLFGKLLFVMGFPWIFEIISWYSEMASPSTAWLWIIFDLINIFQAMAIFYIFVWKKDILHSLCQKYPRFRHFLDGILLEPETATRLSLEYPHLQRIFKRLTKGIAESTSGDRGTTTESMASYNSSSTPTSSSAKRPTSPKSGEIQLKTRGRPSEGEA